MTLINLAVKLQGNLALLIEVKAIGLELKEQHVKQAVDYAANQGCEWVALTNGHIWRVYQITFAKPIENEIVVELDLLNLNPRNSEHIELLGLLSKEGWQKARLGDYASQRQALSRFTLGALILSDSTLEVLRREIRRLSPEVRIEIAEIRSALEADVIKRDVLEGEKAELARKQVAKAAGRLLRAAKGSEESTPAPGAAAKETSTEITESPEEAPGT